MTRLRAIGFAGAGIAIVIAIAIAFFSPLRESKSESTFRGTPFEPPKAATDFVLTGGNGRPAHVIDPSYDATFLFFGYTHCPDECPLAMASLGRAYRKLTTAQASRTRVVFVTVDPKRDTPPVVERYVTNFGTKFVGLTGSAATLRRVWQAYGITIDARTHDIAHGDSIYALDRSKRIVLIYPPDVAAADLAADAAALTST
ncbi:MAG: SCO family protein [Candidatus Eremiobacteraeota bacterium]|nr:SCO family protein [Candidatus Eremiobacteraeota bacterium]